MFIVYLKFLSMSTKVQKNQMHPVCTGEFLFRLRDGVKVVFDAARECDAPSSFSLPLADAISALDTAISICKFYIKD